MTDGGRRVLLALVWLGGCGDDDATGYPDAGGAAVITRDEAERFCAVAGGCIDGVSDCFTDVLPLATAQLVRCAQFATDCAGFWACQGLEAAPDSSCEPGCEDDLLVECPGGTTRRRTDCSVDSETCIEAADGPTCGIEACSEEGARCDGNVLVACDVALGVRTLTFCDQFGWTCEETDSNLARCSDGTDVPCAVGTASRCDGDRLIRCIDGFEVALDCPSLVEGMGCFLLDSRSYCGYGTQCDPEASKGMETCSGTVMTYCASGMTDTLDCADYAFTMCVANATFGGRCTNTL